MKHSNHSNEMMKTLRHGSHNLVVCREDSVFPERVAKVNQTGIEGANCASKLQAVVSSPFQFFKKLY
ncbi:hypothetical protein GUITHDRAFT_155867 [Guillardia theta CCMP2712]|uniref:Uncharacterized protein n=1 Tax=Guillardia theta (strain CCMP2712) TaxID=905079 RepID=L1ICL9_GUITC|nr:hypothetical protein GUITHDRAFT_155867 [Guillardia theta CCMP2712]EKX33996.1 hypothetical protein GUITHDRAFT_155867 [Guillardia theta CCMP2712]|eukprot:XP_005820976.1 hypothetical protein GUITHDRAFT_155867 [Guillardia theta CCMP2712]